MWYFHSICFNFWIEKDQFKKKLKTYHFPWEMKDAAYVPKDSEARHGHLK